MNAARTLRPPLRIKTRDGVLVKFAPEAEFIANVSDNVPNTAKSGLVSMVPIKFGPGRYTLQRAQRKRCRGEETLWGSHWVDPEERARLLDQLRIAIEVRKAARESGKQLPLTVRRTLLRCADQRPALYRHLLLQNIASGNSLVVPTLDWSQNIFKRPSRLQTRITTMSSSSARMLYHPITRVVRRTLPLWPRHPSRRAVSRQAFGSGILCARHLACRIHSSLLRPPP